MKMTKVIMAAALACVAIGLTSCGIKEDDPYEMIKADGKTFTINHTNDTNEHQRGYNPKTFKHAGVTVLVDINTKDTDVSSGIMGLIFNLEAEKDGAKDFNIIGLRTTDKTGNIEYYISKFENVTNLQDKNFGAYDGGTATETAIVPATGTALFAKGPKCTVSEDGSSTQVVIYVEPKRNAQGKIDQNIYLIPYDETKEFKSDGQPKDWDPATVGTLVKTINTGIEASNDYGYQRHFAVYANTYKNSTLIGSWKILGDYHEGELLY